MLIVSDHYVSITPNPVVVGQEVEFRCGLGYFPSYVNDITWFKDDVQVVFVNVWGSTSTLSLDGVITSTKGKPIHFVSLCIEKFQQNNSPLLKRLMEFSKNGMEIQ